MRCPCGAGPTYDECCARFHNGTPAPTATTLMRSRFSAFCLGHEDYLLHTWSPSTRPSSLDLTDSPIKFYRLDIERTEAGGLLDDEGVVEFVAHYKGPTRGAQRERSRFQRGADRRWYYVEGDVH